jgi:hypothetical protein
MRIEQRRWTPDAGWAVTHPAEWPGFRPHLVLLFGGTGLFDDRAALSALREAYPATEIAGCSTAGEIRGLGITLEEGVATALQLESAGAHVEVVTEPLSGASDSEEAGRRIAAKLAKGGLAYVLVLSPGLDVNGSALVRGLHAGLPEGVIITGGLAGDGDRFGRTLVWSAEGSSTSTVLVVGFYGDDLHVGHGSLGGWDPFGPDRLITRSDGNVLYELDGKPALALYRQYLGEHAAGLPASGLLFPLSLKQPDSNERVVRTILAIDEAAGSLTFAGDVPAGSYARLMKANFDRLVDGAAQAGSASRAMLRDSAPELAILISCVGRRLVLQQRTEEEVEAVHDVLGGDPVMTGFYSYGEISPHNPSARCALHNQTMTVTTLREGR